MISFYCIESESQTIKFEFGKSKDGETNCIRWMDNVPSVSRIYLDFSPDSSYQVDAIDALGNIVSDFCRGQSPAKIRYD